VSQRLAQNAHSGTSSGALDLSRAETTSSVPRVFMIQRRPEPIFICIGGPKAHVYTWDDMTGSFINFFPEPT
jgi:hypothetical protein